MAYMSKGKTVATRTKPQKRGKARQPRSGQATDPRPGGAGTRTERDTMGEVAVPADAYYGVQTARAIRNFPISGLRFPRSFIRALGLIKWAAATVNESLGLIEKKVAEAIRKASWEVVEGRWDAEFPVDIFQTGSGTSTNMNANEVIANRAAELLGGARGSKLIHPNDHVNLGQSSNDVIPTAIHVAAVEMIERQLLPALTRLHVALAAKAREFDSVVKIGRTHLQDATPIRLGQEFGGDSRQIKVGPAGGLGEIILPETQPGSSMMPGKVNPVIAESVTMVAAQVMGNDVTIMVGGQAANFELIVMLPVMAHNLLQSIELLARASGNFALRCVEGITADEERCRNSIEQSLAMCTALAPEIGYEAAAKIAKEAHRTGKTVREVARSQQVLPEARLDALLDPWRMTEPGEEPRKRERR